MNTVSKFINLIDEALNLYSKIESYDRFNDLEDWFLENENQLHEENYAIGQLGYEIQDQIAEMSYMDDNLEYIEEIRKIYKKMKDSL